jgi:aminotransferase
MRDNLQRTTHNPPHQTIKHQEDTMKYTARRLEGLQESVIREMTRLALKHDAINMAQGFPDFPPAPEVISAAHQALDRGYNQYTVTWGAPELREAIGAKLVERCGLSYDPEQHVTITCGVSEALLDVMLGLINPGDEVIVIEPFHENYYPIIVFAGAQPVFVTLEPPSYRIDLDALEKAFSNRTRAIIVNSPHNPTGRVFTRDELEGIARLSQKFDVLAITDEIYEHILYDNLPHIPLATLEGMYERTITIGGIGKTFGVTGWRIGYACAPEPYSTALRTVHDYATICAPATFQYAALSALELPNAYYDDLQASYAKRRARMMAILAEHKFTAQPPEGAYYVMSDFSAWDFDGDDHAFAAYLAAQVGVAVVPGSSFYVTADKGRKIVRWAFAKRQETFDAVEERLRRRG